MFGSILAPKEGMRTEIRAKNTNAFWEKLNGSKGVRIVTCEAQ